MKKKVICLLAVTSVLAIGVATSNSAIKPVYAEEEEPVVEVVEEEKDVEEIVKEEWQKFYDTFLVPLLSGISLTSVLSAIISIVMLVKRNSLDKKLRVDNDERLARAKQDLEEAKNMVSVALDLVKELTVQMKEMNSQNAEFLKSIEEQANHIEKYMAETKVLEEVKKCGVLIVKILCDLAASNPKFINSPQYKQIGVLKEQAQKLL